MAGLSDSLAITQSNTLNKLLLDCEYSFAHMNLRSADRKTNILVTLQILEPEAVRANKIEKNVSIDLGFKAAICCSA